MAVTDFEAVDASCGF